MLSKKFLSGTAALQTTTLQVSRLYGMVVVNAVASSFVVFFLGMKVGMGRSKFIEQAKKDGDDKAEERYSYPKMYAEGFDENAKRFNCLQRGHQQALETFPSVLVCSMIGGLRHPILTSMSH